MATANKRERQQTDRMAASQEPLERRTDYNEWQVRGQVSRRGQRRGGLRRAVLQNLDNQKLGRGLGWLSIGLGLAELTAPKAISNLVGVRDNHRVLIRLLGLRQIGHGIGILSQRRPVEGVLSRVGGDAIDLACLAAAFRSRDSIKPRVAAAAAAVMGVTALDVITAGQLRSERTRSTSDIRVSETIIINRPPAEVYQFWRDFENHPRFMSHLASVKVIDRNRSHWVVKTPLGMNVEWDAEVTEDRPNELIAWRSLPGSDMENSGVVRFEPAPGGRGTLVRVMLRYNPPGRELAASVARLIGHDPAGHELQEALRKFKQIMEVGEVLRSDASIHSGMHPAQPPTEPPARARGAGAGR